MSHSESGTGYGAGTALAALASAYGDAPIATDEGDETAAEATGVVERHAQEADAASQPAATEAPAGDARTDATAPAAVASEGDKPFRVFADEADYRRHMDEETKRQREAQSASARETQALRAELDELKRDKESLEAFRNEIYARSQSEELDPQKIVETFIRRDNESKQQFDERKRIAEAARVTEAQRENEGRIVQAGIEHATKAVLLERALDLKDELGDVPGLNVRQALEKAIRESPDAQRHVTDSYELMKRDEQTGQAVPDVARRQRATEAAYDIGKGIVRTQAAALRELAKAPAAETVTPATSIQAPPTLGAEVRRYGSAVEAMAAGYAARR